MPMVSTDGGVPFDFEVVGVKNSYLCQREPVGCDGAFASFGEVFSARVELAENITKFFTKPFFAKLSIVFIFIGVKFVLLSLFVSDVEASPLAVR